MNPYPSPNAAREGLSAGVVGPTALARPRKHPAEESLQFADSEDIAQNREEFPIALRERSLVHRLDQWDHPTLVVKQVAPLKARDREGDGDRPDRWNILEERVEPGRKVWPQGDHEDPKGRDSGRNRALDSIPRVALLDRGQEELERFDFGLSLGGTAAVGFQRSSLRVFGGLTPEESHSITPLAQFQSRSTRAT